MWTVTRNHFLLTLAGSALIVALTASTASATPIYTCPNNSPECAGQTFALWVSNVNAGGFDISFSIDTTGYTGTEDHLAYGVEFKDVITPNDVYDGISLLSAPGGTGSWMASTAQLSQSCGGSDKQDTGCAVWTGAGFGYNFFIGEILTWTFHVTMNTPYAIDWSGGHIKYWYMDDTGRKVAGLLSEGIPLQHIPEPASLALLGLGLVLSARRLRRARA